jgi:DNA polymerase IV
MNQASTAMNWLFTDMNSYFASVEQNFRPELRNRPVAVVPVESDHTSVIAASYEAKKFGIKTGTKVGDARQMCPGLLLVQARPRLYVQIHHALLRCVDRCAPIYKVYSIDEWAVRLVGKECEPDQARLLGERIKREIREEFGPWLTCSIGIAPTRLLAKIASDLQKPDGLTVLKVGDLPGKLEHLHLQSLCGIGEGMLARLNRNGVHTITQLWNINRQQAIAIWGSVSGAHWWMGFRGHDEPEIPTTTRSMSHANVLSPERRTEQGAYGILVRLTCRLGARLRAGEYCARSLRMSIKDVRGNHFSQAVDLPCVQDTPTLLHEFERLWQKRPRSIAAPLKVGVDVAGLTPAAFVAKPLFDEIEKPQRLSKAIDKINQRWGQASIYVGSMHDFRGHMDDKIAFGRIPPTV